MDKRYTEAIMGWNLEGHGECVICRPWLISGWEKKNAKGVRRRPHKVAAKSQESVRLLELLSQVEDERFDADD